MASENASEASNIPLNDDLADAGDPAHIVDLDAVRDDFCAPWDAWEHLQDVRLDRRLGCLAYALVLHGRRGGVAPN